MKARTAVVFASLLLALSAPKVLACSCACDASVTVDDYIDRATEIVIGRVLDLQDRPMQLANDPLSIEFAQLVGVDPRELSGVSSCGERTVRVAVERRLKGKAESELTLVQSAAGTACDLQFPLRAGQTYLLFGFASPDGQTIYLSGCSPSAPAKNAHLHMTNSGAGNRR